MLVQDLYSDFSIKDFFVQNEYNNCTIIIFSNLHTCGLLIFFLILHCQIENEARSGDPESAVHSP